MGLLEMEKRGLMDDREDQDHSLSNSSDRPPLHRPPGRTSSGSRFWERDGVRIWSNSNYFSKEDLDDDSGGHLDAESGPRPRRHPNLRKDPSQSEGKEDEIEDDVLSFFSRMRHDTLENDPKPHGSFDPRQQWVSCWGRFCYELSPCQNWFLVDDPPFTQRTIDVKETFAPQGLAAMISKAFLLASGLAVLATMLVSEQHKLFCMAYFSTWTLFANLAYSVLALYNMLRGASQPFSRVNGTVRASWFLFIVTINAGLLDACLFWANNKNALAASLQFTTLMLHGGLSLQALLDGLLVHRMPLRWMHWWGCSLLFNLVYLGWTVIHFFLKIGNPNENGAEYIYCFLDWGQWKETLVSTVCVLFGLSPAIYCALWLMSMYEWLGCFCFCCWGKERRYYLPVDQLKTGQKSYHKIRQRINLSQYPDDFCASQNKGMHSMQEQSVDHMTEEETVYPEDQYPYSDEDSPVGQDGFNHEQEAFEQSEQSDPFAREFSETEGWESCEVAKGVDLDMYHYDLYDPDEEAYQFDQWVGTLEEDTPQNQIEKNRTKRPIDHLLRAQQKRGAQSSNSVLPPQRVSPRSPK